MAIKKVQTAKLKNASGEEFYPETVSDAVNCGSKNLTESLTNLTESLKNAWDAVGDLNATPPSLRAYGLRNQIGDWYLGGSRSYTDTITLHIGLLDEEVDTLITYVGEPKLTRPAKPATGLFYEIDLLNMSVSGLSDSITSINTTIGTKFDETTDTIWGAINTLSSDVGGISSDYQERVSRLENGAESMSNDISDLKGYVGKPSIPGHPAILGTLFYDVESLGDYIEGVDGKVDTNSESIGNREDESTYPETYSSIWSTIGGRFDDDTSMEDTIWAHINELEDRLSTIENNTHRV